MTHDGHVRLRDRLAFWATRHIPGVARLRGWWHDRNGTPGFRPGDWE